MNKQAIQELRFSLNAVLAEYREFEKLLFKVVKETEKLLDHFEVFTGETSTIVNR